MIDTTGGGRSGAGAVSTVGAEIRGANRELGR